jgi:hypothetical protein
MGNRRFRMVAQTVNSIRAGFCWFESPRLNSGALMFSAYSPLRFNATTKTPACLQANLLPASISAQ